MLILCQQIEEDVRFLARDTCHSHMYLVRIFQSTSFLKGHMTIRIRNFRKELTFWIEIPPLEFVLHEQPENVQRCLHKDIYYSMYYNNDKLGITNG